MDQTGYVILTIALVVVLIAVFTISFVAYVKTPAPKGCERTKGPNCENCDQASCRFYSFAEQKAAEKAKEKIEESKETSDRKE